MFIAACFCACNNASNEKTESTTEIEIAYNESIQNQFFGFSFGATPQEVNEKLNSAGLRTSDRFVRNGRLSYNIPYTNNSFTFGGYSWHWCYPYFSNNRLYLIEFLHPCKTKEAAASQFKSLSTALMDKYHMQNAPQSNTSIYDCYVGKTSTRQSVSVSYQRYEGNDHEMWYGVFLRYSDWNFYQENDEL